jgi:hypothetical protein
LIYGILQYDSMAIEIRIFINSKMVWYEEIEIFEGIKIDIKIE